MARVPMASEAQIFGALAANMALTDVILGCISDTFYMGIDNEAYIERFW
jgi:hypothetical protein